MNLRKECFKHILAEDLKRFGNKRPGLKDLVLHNEVWYIYHYIRHLRFIEYYGVKIHSRGGKMLVFNVLPLPLA